LVSLVYYQAYQKYQRKEKFVVDSRICALLRPILQETSGERYCTEAHIGIAQKATQ
jgi:hypothetical protein